MMKKFLAILLAMMLVLVNVAALADEGDTTTEGGTTGTTESGTTGTEGGTTGGTTTGGDKEPADYLPTDDQEVSIDPGTDTAGAAATVAKKVTIQKKVNLNSYKEDNKDTGSLPNNLKVNFTVDMDKAEKAMTTAPTIPEVTFDADTVIDPKTGLGTVSINLPSYEYVGVYTYPVTETATNVAGVKEAAALKLTITVIQNGNNLQVAGVALRQSKGEDGEVKVSEIENVYEAGSLTVKKTVHGNMGDQKKDFPITITLKAPAGKTVESTVTYKKSTDTNASTVTWNAAKTEATINVTLKHDETVQIDNIPAGVTYTVAEDAWDDTAKTGIKHVDKDTDEPENENAYKVEGQIDTATEISVAQNPEKEIKNTKNITIDTGIELETLPFVLLMGIALVGVMALRRREDY